MFHKTKLLKYNLRSYTMCRINYVEVSVLTLFTGIALYFGTKNIPVSLTVVGLSYLMLLAHAFNCKNEKSKQEKETSDHDIWNRIYDIDEKFDTCCKSDERCSAVKNCQSKTI